mmetsp:Transcript_3456/g.13181  ORF Transcript_3456/g.13181 Transcript_3456/m.13181 type:complete len:107 (+) Transcript_3456:3-323(+)
MTRFDSWLPIDIDFVRRWVLYNFWLLPRQRRRGVAMVSVSAAFATFYYLSQLYKEPVSDEGVRMFNSNYTQMTRNMTEYGVMSRLQTAFHGVTQAAANAPTQTRFQ